MGNITYKWLNKRAELAADFYGKEYGTRNIGAWNLERAYGGRYELFEIVNSGGGIKRVSQCLTNREMCEFLSGLIAGARIIKEAI